MKTSSIFLACFAVLLLLGETRAESVATPVPFESANERAVLDAGETIHLGSGFATHAALLGDFLSVATARRDNQELRTPWFGVNAVDIYRFGKDGAPIFLTKIPMQYPVRLLATEANRLYVGDEVGVTSYALDSKTGKVSLLWKFPIEDVESVARFAPSLLMLRSDRFLQVVEDLGNACLPRGKQAISSARLVTAGIKERYFLVGTTGQAQLYSTDSNDRFMFLRDLPIFGQVQDIAYYGENNAFVLDRQFGLRWVATQGYMRTRQDLDGERFPKSFDDSRFAKPAFKAKYFVDELALKTEHSMVRAFGTWVYLVDAKGKLSAVEVDATKRKLGELKPVTGVGAVVEVAGDANRQVAIERDGSVVLLAAGKAEKPVEAVEPGPWSLQNGTLWVANGPALYTVENGAFGKELYRGDAQIRDIQTQDSRLWILTGKQLVVAENQNGTVKVLGTLPVPAKAVMVRVGLTHAAVVHGERGLMLVDIRDPQQLKQLADRELELPTHSELPSKVGAGASFEREIRDVLIESNRLFVVGTEIFLFDLQQFAADATWKRMWHRPYVSADDALYTTSMTALGENRYLVTAYRDTSRVHTRAYVLTMNGDEFADWRYCRLGAGSALDVQVRDGLTGIAAGDDGVRLLRLGATDSYLGSDREPGEVCQAVLLDKDHVYAKSGNTIRTYRYWIEKAKEPTAFTFPPGKLPKLVVDGLDITSEEYRQKMGYRNRLKLVEADLSDKAGFPKVEVKQGTVAVDAKLGRLKFADGRNQEPKFLARSEYINVVLAGWRKAGPYVIAALSEQSQGFAVMDLSDPSCMKILSVAGQPNYFTYPHTVVAYRDRFAYITGNIMNCLLPVNMKDPLNPKYERMINLENSAVTKFSCVTHYSGFFRGDRLFVPGAAGLTEVDVSDPTNIKRIAVHTKASAIHQVLENGAKAVRWNDGKIDYLDITDVAEPKVIGTYPTEGKVDFAPLTTVTVDKSTYILTLSNKKKNIVRVDISDMQHPKLAHTYDVPEDIISILPEGNYVYMSGSRSFYVIDWSQPTAPRQVGALAEKDFLGRWHYSFKEDVPRPTVVAGGNYEIDLQLELKDGNTVWMERGAASYGVDVSDPARPKVVGSGPGFGEVWWIRADESDIVSIGSYRRNFIDISNPLKPHCQLEYSHGHPFESGWPSNGDGGQYHIGNKTIWRWERDAKGGELRLQPDALLPIWFGPDPDTRANNRPLSLITSGSSGITKVQSVPITVTPGERLTVAGLIRTFAYPDLGLVNHRSPIPDNTVTISLIKSGAKHPLWSMKHDRGDGVLRGMEGAFVVPPGTQALTLELAVTGDVWLTDLKVLRGSENLLTNGSFDKPLDDRGQHPGWTVTQASAQRFNSRSFTDGDTLYVIQGRALFIYDLKQKSLFPVARMRIALDDDWDAPWNIYVRREGARKIAYLITYHGLVTVDVTDIRQPAKLGAVTIPWFLGANYNGAFDRNIFVASQGFTSDKLTQGFYLIDISNPAQPFLRSIVPGRVHSGVICHNGYLYLGDYSQGMQIWDITNPDRPLLVTDQGFVRCSQTWAIEFNGDNVLRPEVGGLELWQAPVRPQAPEGKLTVE